MSNAKRKARAMAAPLALSRMEGRGKVSKNAERLKLESQHGTHVPEKVVNRMSSGTTGARTNDGDGIAKIRPKRKARSVASEMAAAGNFGRAFGSSGDGIKRVSDQQIEANRRAYFKASKASRKIRVQESTDDILNAARAAFAK